MIRSERGVWCIETERTGYYIARRGDLAEQLHYGRKIRPDAGPLREKLASSYCTDAIYDETWDAGVSLHHVGLELSPVEKGDFRRPALEITMPDGSRVSDWKLREEKVLPASPEADGLPQAYGGGECLALCFENEWGVRVEALYTPYDECDVIVRRYRILNGSGAPITIRRAMSYQLDLPRSGFLLTTLTGAWAREFEPKTQPLAAGAAAFGSTTGASSHYCNPLFLLSEKNADENAGEVYAFNLIYSGSHQEWVETDSFGRTRVEAGIQPEGFAWTLAPGEVFDTPEAVLAFSGEGKNGASRSMHRFVRAHVSPRRWSSAERPVLVNNWEATYFGFTEEKLLQLAHTAAGLGAELFVLDDGWFGRRTSDLRGLGDFDVNPDKLPSGLDGLAAGIEREGLRFGLWVEPEMVNEDSALYEAHPDWAVQPPKGQPCRSRHQLVLDLCRTQVQDYLIEQLDNVLSSAPISYVKWDMNRHHTDRFSSALEEQGHFAHAWMLGFYRVLGEVTRRHPDILFEGCASGGNRFDLGVLCFFPQIWLSDDTDAWERARIQSGASLGYPQSTMGCHVSAVPNHQTLRVTPLESRFDVAVFGAFGYEMDLTAVTPGAAACIAAQIAWFKEHRVLFQQGQMYRLVSPFETDECAWMVVSEDRTQAAVLEMISLVHPNSAQPPLRLTGLDPDRTYEISVRPQFLETERFGSMVRQAFPELEQVPELFPCEQGTMTASGSLLMYAGIRRRQRFGGFGIAPDVRIMPDFSARIYLLKALPE